MPHFPNNYEQTLLKSKGNLTRRSLIMHFQFMNKIQNKKIDFIYE